MSKRNIITVIDNIINKFHTKEHRIITFLNQLKYDISFMAPELERDAWAKLAKIVNSIGRPIQEWEFEVYSELSTIPVDEIKRLEKEGE